MRFRMYPSTAQEVLLLEACGQARFVWNLGLEQRLMWARWKGPTPGFNAQAKWHPKRARGGNEGRPIDALASILIDGSRIRQRLGKGLRHPEHSFWLVGTGHHRAETGEEDGQPRLRT